LNHPNIITIYEVGEWQGRTFIATELVSGQSLAQRIATGPVSVEESVRIAIQIAQALAAAHAAGVIHRDLKPANVADRWCRQGARFWSRANAACRRRRRRIAVQTSVIAGAAGPAP
jgi:hypothetical protein